MEYNVKELTSESMRCACVACPSIYEITPKEMKCVIGACPSIFTKEDKNYYIIGEKVNEKELKKLGLEKKVGENEIMIKIDKRIIDKKQD